MSNVIVVGAGPTGLLLAGDLAEAGVDVTLIERRGGDVPNISRAMGVHARTMELLDARGLADDLLATGAARVSDLQLFGRVEVDLSRLPSRFPYLLITAQYNVERLLLERAVTAGVTFVYDTEVVGVRQDSGGVSVETRGQSGGAATLRAEYVVGADGVHSSVRHALGLPFPGRSVLKSIMLADVRLTTEPAQAVTVNGVGDCFAFIAPFGDGWYRVFAWDRRNQVPDTAPLGLDEIADVTRRALGVDLGLREARWMSRFHSDERQAPQYRVGRIFLAGDAAHCHSPAGGQGMNTGMQDAANLAWKLASVLRGAPGRLLDTYEAERYPVGREVLRSSGAIIRLAMIRSALGRALRGLIGGSLLRIPAIARVAAGQLSGIGISYGREGRRAPDVRLADGTRLYEALRGGKFVLVGSAGSVDSADSADSKGFEDRVQVVAGDSPMLVRPDGYLAWDGTGPLDLAEWCGLPK